MLFLNFCIAQQRFLFSFSRCSIISSIIFRSLLKNIFINWYVSIKHNQLDFFGTGLVDPCQEGNSPPLTFFVFSITNTLYKNVRSIIHYTFIKNYAFMIIQHNSSDQNKKYIKTYGNIILINKNKK